MYVRVRACARACACVYVRVSMSAILAPPEQSDLVVPNAVTSLCLRPAHLGREYVCVEGGHACVEGAADAMTSSHRMLFQIGTSGVRTGCWCRARTGAMGGWTAPTPCCGEDAPSPWGTSSTVSTGVRVGVGMRV